MQTLLGLLSHFFAQSSALNLALAGVISALALCPYRSLEGWIAFQERGQTKPDGILILDSSNITSTTNSNTTMTTPTSTPASSTTTSNTLARLEDEAKIQGKDIYAHFSQSLTIEDQINEE
ncbi:hypothetical protein DM01DRAFT_314506 [Hesseltinella vesiculosa]|uniref:FHF complex subunit HOOK-interacting protein C-terminal domain-containing protein n=1 Tax=Hesseltinella vesiculosa TaxID=101127 RepID=A0A1X2G384_9FUNG|nr:hypothetical protein DM01DRAFT_314506 [Hesseltinella vesiculosa]